jgi:hypothetical protein
MRSSHEVEIFVGMESETSEAINEYIMSVTK